MWGSSHDTTIICILKLVKHIYNYLKSAIRASGIIPGWLHLSLVSTGEPQQTDANIKEHSLQFNSHLSHRSKNTDISTVRTQVNKRCLVWLVTTSIWIYFEWTPLRSRRGCGVSSLASWLSRLRLGSHMISPTWSHGEADINKTGISSVQRLAVLKAKAEC